MYYLIGTAYVEIYCIFSPPSSLGTKSKKFHVTPVDRVLQLFCTFVLLDRKEKVSLKQRP